MSEEEKEAIEILQGLCTDDCVNNDIVKTIVKLIEKQQKEIEYLKSQIPQDKIFYYSEKDYISKDKIKAKIEEITSYVYTSLEEKEKQDYAIYELKRLLEE